MNFARLIATASIAVAAVASLAACGETSNDAAQESPATASTGSAAPAGNGIPCSQAGDLSGTPERKPPADLPLPPGGQLYMSKGPFGKTELFFVAKDADPTNLDGVRDEAADVLAKAGYKIERKDQEEGSEAEAHLSGPHEVAIQVIQLCEGKVRVKYTLS
ncbi:hypothetical protein ACIBK1_08585 [Microbispora rosea]|uniref:Lipoprotein n=1 Tax=Microbispora rosea TaxID=58117 RepID=A0A1N6V2G1_9ACTN|nr:hypothetical protein [Microbispora rosea]GIH46748.1 hypothetical protein Mro03_19270 [Microbispora rosea subsp. rosea]SIQ72055.1 hypothetical protein SAMN05421833_103246 [Microbispora rosea]